jgi:hypothetical protein
MVDAQNPTAVTIVELKTPNYPLRIEHLNQLEGYMMRVEDYLKSKFTGPMSVRGYLIGDTDQDSKSEAVKLLNKKHLEAGPLSTWEVIPLPVLLERAKQIHLDAISVAMKYEEFLDAELDTSPSPAATDDAAPPSSEET